MTEGCAGFCRGALGLRPQYLPRWLSCVIKLHGEVGLQAATSATKLDASRAWGLDTRVHEILVHFEWSLQACLRVQICLFRVVWKLRFSFWFSDLCPGQFVLMHPRQTRNGTGGAETKLEGVQVHALTRLSRAHDTKRFSYNSLRLG